MPTQTNNTETKPITVRLPVDLIARIDELCDKGGFSRTSGISLILNSGIGIVEVLLNPAKMLSDPLAAEYIGHAMTKVLEEKQNEEESKQSAQEKPKRSRKSKTKA